MTTNQNGGLAAEERRRLIEKALRRPENDDLDERMLSVVADDDLRVFADDFTGEERAQRSADSDFPAGLGVELPESVPPEELAERLDANWVEYCRNECPANVVRFARNNNALRHGCRADPDTLVHFENAERQLRELPAALREIAALAEKLPDRHRRELQAVLDRTDWIFFKDPRLVD